jgi:acyl-homoserine-lactone acylase
MSKTKRWVVSGLVMVSVIAMANLFLGVIDENNFDAQQYLEKRKTYQVTIKRDIWGVPHIEGKKDSDTAFGFAVAQAEDHYPIIEDSMRFYRGVQSASSGYESVPLDYLVHLLNIRSQVDRQYDQVLSEDVKRVLNGFADGLNYWAAKNPEKVDQKTYPITAKDLVASFSLQHLLFYGIQKPITELFDEQRKHSLSMDSNETAWQLTEERPLPVGSNAFAISPSRSADGSTRILINSHQPLTGPVAWYEAHLKSDEGWHVMGGAFPGSPVITVGANEHVAWGATVNKPDLVDIYVLEINPDNENQYRLDNEWLNFEVKQAAIRVKIIGNFYWTVTQDLFYSEHGPVIKQDHGVYAIRYAGHGEIRQVEQWFDMSKSTSLASWEKAMDRLAISSFNFVAADAAGNIGFFHNSQSPIRKEGFDWKGYLPGNRSDLIWNEYLPFADLPQVVNPNSGFLLSTNQSPFHVTAPEDNVKRSDYSETFGFPTRMTNRATRGLELFSELELITADDFKKIKFDNSYSPNSRAINYLSDLFDVEYPVDSLYQQPLELLKNWDLATDVDNTAANLGVCTISEEWISEQSGQSPPAVQGEFEKCVDILLEKHGRVDVAWGETNRLIRGSVNEALNGGPDVLRAIYGRGLEDDGYLTASGGDGLFIFVSWDGQGKQSIESIHQFGSATVEESSPHYADQLPLFIDEKLKETYFDTESLQSNIKSEYVP